MKKSFRYFATACATVLWLLILLAIILWSAWKITKPNDVIAAKLILSVMATTVWLLIVGLTQHE